MKIDPHKYKERYLHWRENINSQVQDINSFNSGLIIRYLDDMERGINISNVSIKGSRSYARLYSLKERLIFFAKKFEELYNLKSITDIDEDQLLSFFSDMRMGKIRKIDGGQYISIDTYTKVFKAFWHWYQKVSKKKGIEIPEITKDLDTKQEKPKWVYLCVWDNFVFEHPIFDKSVSSPGNKKERLKENIRILEKFKGYIKDEKKIIKCYKEVLFWMSICEITTRGINGCERFDPEKVGMKLDPYLFTDYIMWDFADPLPNFSFASCLKAVLEKLYKNLDQKIEINSLINSQLIKEPYTENVSE